METNIMVAAGLQLKKLIEKKMLPIAEKNDVKCVDLEILFFLAKNRYVDTAKEIRKKKHLSKAYVSKSLENLYEKGFIKVREDEKDHRLIHISLKKKSFKVVDEVALVYEECRKIAQKDISAEKMEIMKEVFCKMNQNLEEELNKY